MTFVYTQAQLLSDTNRKIFGKIGMISSQEDFINEVVREVHNDIAIRSTRRKMSLAPHLFPSIYQYAAPSDLRDYKIIDIPAQAKNYEDSFNMVTVEQFNNRPTLGDIAIDDYNGLRTLLINADLSTSERVISELDSLGSWTAFGGADNVEADRDDYIKGAGSLSFDIDASSDTTAGLVNTDINEFDITDFLGGDSSVFVWAKINSPTDIVNYKLRLGTDASNYFTQTITARHDGNAFVAGWNLLRFDLTSLVEQGTVTKTSINYAAIYMTKDTDKVIETDYKFDWLTIMKGQRHDVTYYSKYGWQTSAGVYIQKSTTSSDLLLADESEYPLFLAKAKHIGLQETNNDENTIDRAEKSYKEAVATYGQNNPDESQLIITTYNQQ